MQNREIQQFLGEIFVQFAYRHFPITMLYYNQDKGRGVNKMIQYTILRVDNKITEDYGEVHAYSRVSSNKDS